MGAVLPAMPADQCTKDCAPCHEREMDMTQCAKDADAPLPAQSEVVPQFGSSKFGSPTPSPSTSSSTTSPRKRRAQSQLAASADGAEKLDMLFVTENLNEERLISFTQSQLGMTLKNTDPITVGRVMENGQAHKLGVQEGWQLLQIDGRCVESVPKELLQEFMDDNAQSNSPPEAATLSIDFVFNGENVTVVFSQAPLGIEFESENRFRVSKLDPSTYAYSCGVRPGSEVVRIGNEDVRCLDWVLVLQRIAEKAGNLPKATKVVDEQTTKVVDEQEKALHSDAPTSNLEPHRIRSMLSQKLPDLFAKPAPDAQKKPNRIRSRLEQKVPGLLAQQKT